MLLPVLRISNFGWKALPGFSFARGSMRRHRWKGRGTSSVVKIVRKVFATLSYVIVLPREESIFIRKVSVNYQIRPLGYIFFRGISGIRCCVCSHCCVNAIHLPKSIYGLVKSCHRVIDLTADGCLRDGRVERMMASLRSIVKYRIIYILFLMMEFCKLFAYCRTYIDIKI